MAFLSPISWNVFLLPFFDRTFSPPLFNSTQLSELKIEMYLKPIASNLLLSNQIEGQRGEKWKRPANIPLGATKSRNVNSCKRKTNFLFAHFLFIPQSLSKRIQKYCCCCFCLCLCLCLCSLKSNFCQPQNRKRKRGPPK